MSSGVTRSARVMRVAKPGAAATPRARGRGTGSHLARVGALEDEHRHLAADRDERMERVVGRQRVRRHARRSRARVRPATANGANATVAVAPGADRDALGVHAVTVDLERDLAIGHRLRARSSRRARPRVRARPSRPASCSSVRPTTAAFAGAGSATDTVVSVTPARQLHVLGGVPAGLLEVRDEHDLAARAPPTDSSRPAAARRAGPNRVSPGPGRARSIAAISAARARLRSGADLDVRREEHDRAAVAGREARARRRRAASCARAQWSP